MNTYRINKGRILAVDDEPQILELFCKTLGSAREISDADDKYDELSKKLFGESTPKNEAAQFEITFCHQSTEAVKAVHDAMRENNPYAVAFVDVRMPPGPDGVWAAQRIREIDPHIEIVIVTGYTDKTPHEMSCWVPPADKLLYLQKPFHPHEIKQMAVALTSKWHAESRLRELRTELEGQVEQKTSEFIQVNEALRKDMAKRRQVEENLRKEQQRLSTVLDGIPIPTFMIDHDHQVVFWNRAEESLSKIPRGQVLGQSIPVQLEQMIINLAVNAKDAMPNGGKLRIKTDNRVLDETDCIIQPEALPGKYILLQVSDSGHGMDKTTQACIFDPFFYDQRHGPGHRLGTGHGIRPCKKPWRPHHLQQ